MFWELFFFLVVLKLPVLYLCGVVYWAIRAVPEPFEPAVLPVAPVDPDRPCPWHRTRRPPRLPHRPRASVARR